MYVAVSPSKGLGIYPIEDVMDGLLNQRLV